MGGGEKTVYQHFIRACLVRVRNYPTSLELRKAAELEGERKTQKGDLAASSKKKRARNLGIRDENLAFISNSLLVEIFRAWLITIPELNRTESQLAILKNLKNSKEVALYGGKIVYEISTSYKLDPIYRKKTLVAGEEAVYGYAGICARPEHANAQLVGFEGEDFIPGSIKTLLVQLAGALRRPYPFEPQRGANYIKVGGKTQRALLQYNNLQPDYELLVSNQALVKDQSDTNPHLP